MVSGSMVCIWYSRRMKGLPGWVYALGYYEPPTRVFTYNPMYEQLINLPPGTPRAVAPDLQDWEMVRK